MKPARYYAARGEAATLPAVHASELLAHRRTCGTRMARRRRGGRRLITQGRGLQRASFCVARTTHCGDLGCDHCGAKFCPRWGAPAITTATTTQERAA